MKKKFQKISRFVFIAGVIDIIALLLIVVNTSEIIEGPLAVIILICIFIAFLTIIFAVINFFIALIEGWKKNKKDFLKRFIVQIMVMMLIYAWLDWEDGLKEVNILEILGRSIAMSVGIIGGEYMITKHKDEDSEELHF